MRRALRATALTTIVLELLFAAATPASAGWRSINTLNYDDGGQVCPDAVRFSLAHFFQRVALKITNTTPDPDVVVHPRTTRTLFYAPVPDLFGDFGGSGEPYFFSRNLQIDLDPQPKPGDELRINFFNVEGTGASSTVTETVEDCTQQKHFKGFDAPIENPAVDPVLNPAAAGSTVKLSFSLLGNHGPSIFSEAPTFAPIPCSSEDAVPTYQPSAARGGLRYRADIDRYVFRWRTPDTVSGCYAIWFRTNVDETLTHRALFDFS
jgi:hypothetical protein